MIFSPSESWIKKKIKVTHEYQPEEIKPLLCQQTGIEEAERSLHDAIMIVRRALKNSTVVAGGGAIDVCV